MRAIFHFSIFLCLASGLGVSEAADLSPDPRSLSLEVSVLRFKPAKADRILKGFHDLSGNLENVINSLRVDGEVTVLYNGYRDLQLTGNSKAKFDALETRPVLIASQPLATSPVATSYGLSLEVSATPSHPGTLALEWVGTITWSPEVIDRWGGDKFLAFIGGAANVAKAAGNFSDQDNKVSAGADIGLSLAQLFSPGGKVTGSEIYELPVQKTVSFASGRFCKDGELLVNATTAEMGSKEAQTILLLISPRIRP